MEATLVQPMQMLGTDSTVTYDKANQTIAVTVVVSLRPGDEDITVVVAPVTVPKGEWSLYWNLVVDTPRLMATFNKEKGIDMSVSSVPPKVFLVEGPAGISPVQWLATFRNDVLDVNAFSYDVYIDWSSGATQVFKTTRHDPTIAVTKDPI